MKNLRKILALVLLSTILLGCGCTEKKQYGSFSLEDVSSYPFFGTDSDGASTVAAVNNALFENFGSIGGTTSLVYKFGNEATYFEWIAEKIMFTSDTAYKEELKEKIKNYPQTETGYLWSWTTSPWWPTGKGDMHYDGIFRYLSAVYDVVRYENSLAFLDEVCEIGTTEGLNGTFGKTVYEKCDLAINYALKYLHGEDGVIRLTAESMFLADGVTRIDEKDGVCLWNNTGKAGSSASNYWDNLCFGNYDGYETMLFYHALQDMSALEKMRNNTQNAEKYADVACLVRQKFNEYFWNEDTGRYVGCIDVDGNKKDFGFTFLNTEALAYGLGDAEKAALIFSWLDGTRIVADDTVTGKDIFNYTRLLNSQRKKDNQVKQELYLAPVSNTKAIESYPTEDGYWWNSLEGAITIDKSGNASYGKHLENGGYVFYTVYYELLARAKYQSIEKVLERYRQIAEVYVYNRLDSDEGGWLEGLCGEFPESGLVFAAYLYTLLGIDVRENALCIKLSLTDDGAEYGVKDFCFASALLTVSVNKNGFSVRSEDALSAPLAVSVLPNKTYTVKSFGANNVLLSEQQYTFTEESFFLLPYEKGSRTVVLSVE